MAVDTEIQTNGRPRRDLAVATAIAVASVLVAGGLVLVIHDQHRNDVSSSDRGSLTADQYDTAVSVARTEIARESKNAGGNAPTISSAVATVVPGVVQQPNLADACTSGQLLVVSLVGDFPGIAIGSPEEGMGAETGPDMWVTVKADAASGEACLMGVSLGKFQAPTGSADLTPAL